MSLRNLTHPKFPPELNTRLTQLDGATQNISDQGVLIPAGGGTGLSAPASLGDTLYGLVTGLWERLTGNKTTTRKFLAQTGDGVNSAAPVWAVIVITDISNLGANVGTFLGTPSSATLRSALTDENGTGAALFDGATSPTFATSEIVPLVIGGSGTTQTLILRPTSGNGITGADIIFEVGNNGATEAMRILNSGKVGVGTTVPSHILSVGSGFPTISAAQTTFQLVVGHATDARLGVAVGTGQAVVARAQSTYAGLNAFDYNAGVPFALVLQDPAFGAGGNVGIGITNPARLLHVAGRHQLGGTAEATTDWALTSGWGAGATISAVTGSDSRGTVTVQTSVLDTPTLNPVITLTFKDGTWTTVPFVMANMNSASTGTMGAASCKATATTLVIVYDGTPTALTAATYIFNYLVVG